MLELETQDLLVAKRMTLERIVMEESELLVEFQVQNPVRSNAINQIQSQ